jgi:splicing factor 3A subunit 3
MSHSELERQRLLHQDMEQLEKDMTRVLLESHSTHKHRMIQMHHISEDLNRYISTAKQLHMSYEDVYGARAKELAALTGDKVFDTFYDRLEAIRTFHKQRPAAAQFPLQQAAATDISQSEHTATSSDGKSSAKSSHSLNAIDTMDDDMLLRVIHKQARAATQSKLESAFTGAEFYGRFLDMHSLYERCINLIQFKTMSYVKYLGSFHQLNDIPSPSKLRGQPGTLYQQYVRDLLSYLRSFHSRVYPLADQSKMITLMRTEFNKLWSTQKLLGWFATKNNGVASASADSGSGSSSGSKDGASAIDVDNVAAADGGGGDDNDDADDDAKQPAADPLFCTACQKKFAKSTTFDSHLSGRKHKKNAQLAAALRGEPTTTGDSKSNNAASSVALLQAKKQSLMAQRIAFDEFQVKTFCDLLKDQVEATKTHVEKKQTLTYEEIVAELEEQQAAEDNESESESDDEDQMIYNPKNVPLDWDGKPIPYWLYKLHGLNIEYNCQICGDSSYRGPKNYEKHFQEARHTHGLRCLGIPNTKHFMYVSKIQDAVSLYERLKKLSHKKEWDPDEHEEFEDSDGRVYDKRTYEDLRKQGLL